MTSTPAVGRPPRPIALDEPVPGFDHTAVEVPGGRLHVVTGGAGPETLVLIAGFPQTWYAWHEVMAILGEHHRVIAVDLPGQGLSTRFDGPADTETVAKHLHAALDTLVDGPYWLVAHDVGAWVSFTYALLYSDELRGLALLDAGIPGVTLPEAIPLDPARARKLWHFAFHQVPDLPEILLTGKEHDYVRWFLRAKTADPSRVAEADIDLYARALTRDGAVTAALSHYRVADQSARRNQELLTERGPISVPVLAVDSDHGSIPDMATPLTTFATTVTAAHITDAGHFIPEEQPLQLTTALLRFMARTQPATQAISPTSFGVTVQVFLGVAA